MDYTFLRLNNDHISTGKDYNLICIGQNFDSNNQLNY